MKIIKNIIEFMLGTSIIWLPILATIIAEKIIRNNNYGYDYDSCLYLNTSTNYYFN